MNKKQSAMWGLLIADAVGTPYEFKRPESLPPYDQLEMEPPAGFKKSWSQFPTGIWSDDGSQALCLLEHYLEGGDEVWHDRWARKLIKWYQGHLWVDGKSFDAGIQTREAIQNLKAGVHPLSAGNASERANGNGSLMRTLPVTLMCGDMERSRFFSEVENISYITHPHPRARLACVLYCEVARWLLTGAHLNDAIAQADEAIREHYEDAGLMMAQYEVVWNGQYEEPTGTGYVVDALWSAFWSLRGASTYEDVVKRAISLGNDTDTTACIAGGLAGIIYGYSGIPQRWLDALKGKDQIQHLIESLK